MGRRICEALQAGGVAWDQKIRGQIRDCALFIPVISATTASGHEGYFTITVSIFFRAIDSTARSTRRRGVRLVATEQVSPRSETVQPREHG